MNNIPNISSEEELLQLRNDGKISEDEYQELLAAIRKSSVKDTVNTATFATIKDVPWQIWVVVALLALEGIGNLLYISKQSMALIWFGAKCLFILGLLKRWRWVFCLFVIIGIIHFMFFLLQAPLFALINLAMVVLVLSSFRFYFRSQAEYNYQIGAKEKLLRLCADIPRCQSSNQDSKRKQGKIAFYLMLVGIVLPIVGFFVCFAISGGGDGDVIFSVCLFLFVLIEIPAFVLGVISLPDVLGKATVTTILALAVFFIIFSV
ncbi:MAG: hypothetical protein ACYS3S_03550 [Planctomycetota bacterium]|jgi:hypothetical protein